MKQIDSVCIVCNDPFVYTRRSPFQIRVTCGRKECMGKAQQLTSPGEGQRGAAHLFKPLFQ